MSAVAPALASMWHDFGAPWEQLFMRRALIEIILLSVCGGVLGCWIVFYELTFSAEALPHTMFPGLVGASLLGIPLIVGGAVGLLVAAVAIAAAVRTELVGRDTAVAVVFTSLFGLGVLMALSPQSPAGVSGLLFGDILGLTNVDLMLAGGLAVLVLVGLRVLHPRLLAVALDRPSARAVGARPAVIDQALVLLIALATLVAVQAMGNIFVVATLVAPAAAARHLTRRITTMMAVAVAVGIVAGLAGLYLSYYANVAAGASIALFDVLIYAVVRAWAALPAPYRTAFG